MVEDFLRNRIWNVDTSEYHIVLSGCISGCVFLLTQLPLASTVFWIFFCNCLHNPSHIPLNLCEGKTLYILMDLISESAHNATWKLGLKKTDDKPWPSLKKSCRFCHGHNQVTNWFLEGGIEGGKTFFHLQCFQPGYHYWNNSQPPNSNIKLCL